MGRGGRAGLQSGCEQLGYLHSYQAVIRQSTNIYKRIITFISHHIISLSKHSPSKPPRFRNFPTHTCLQITQHLLLPTIHIHNQQIRHRDGRRRNALSFKKLIFGLGAAFLEDGGAQEPDAEEGDHVHECREDLGGDVGVGGAGGAEGEGDGGCDCRL